MSIAVLAAAIYTAWILDREAEWMLSTRTWLHRGTDFVSSFKIPTSRTANDTWNLLYHLGGNGPWIPKVSNIVEAGIQPPRGCRVDQVHMVGLIDSTFFALPESIASPRYPDMPKDTLPPEPPRVRT